MSEVKAYLLDMDGTLFLEESPIEGAIEFLDFLSQESIPFALVTNNSSKSRKVYTETLGKMGFKVESENIFSSGIATAMYLKKEGIEKVYLLGTPALKQEFIDYGIEIDSTEPQAVVLGFDQTLDYEKMVKMHRFLLEGKRYIATHPDFVCPMIDGSIPDTGAMIAMFEASSGRSPEVVGKPNSLLVEMACEQLGVQPFECMMVGDRIYTDMKMAKNAGVKSGLVLTGEATVEDVSACGIEIDRVYQSVKDIHLERLEEIK